MVEVPIQKISLLQNLVYIRFAFSLNSPSFIEKELVPFVTKFCNRKGKRNEHADKE